MARMYCLQMIYSDFGLIINTQWFKYFWPIQSVHKTTNVSSKLCEVNCGEFPVQFHGSLNIFLGPASALESVPKIEILMKFVSDWLRRLEQQLRPNYSKNSSFFSQRKQLSLIKVTWNCKALSEMYSIIETFLRLWRGMRSTTIQY